MMELADAGAKVLHSRSVEMAAKYGVTLEVRSSFTGKPDIAHPQKVKFPREASYREYPAISTRRRSR